MTYLPTCNSAHNTPSCFEQNQDKGSYSDRLPDVDGSGL
jgi:hypothetical protein